MKPLGWGNCKIMQDIKLAWWTIQASSGLGLLVNIGDVEILVFCVNYNFKRIIALSHLEGGLDPGIILGPTQLQTLVWNIPGYWPGWPRLAPSVNGTTRVASIYTDTWLGTNQGSTLLNTQYILDWMRALLHRPGIYVNKRRFGACLKGLCTGQCILDGGGTIDHAITRPPNRSHYVGRNVKTCYPPTSMVRIIWSADKGEFGHSLADRGDVYTGQWSAEWTFFTNVHAQSSAWVKRPWKMGQVERGGLCAQQ